MKCRTRRTMHYPHALSLALTSACSGTSEPPVQEELRVQAPKLEHLESHPSELPHPDLPRLEAVDAGLTTNLRGVSVPSELVVWASGAKGSYTRSVDGGKTWRPAQVNGAEALDFRDVHAFGPDRALLLSAGAPARIYETRDGGDTWTLRYENTDERIFFDAMDFWDEGRGLAMGDPIDGRFQIIMTRDGGASWQALDDAELPKAVAGEAGFAGSGTALRVGTRGRAWFGSGGGAARVFRLNDYGPPFEAADAAIEASPSCGVFSIDFFGELGVAVGGDYRREGFAGANLAMSTDGGRNWSLKSDQLGGFREVVMFRPGHEGNELVALGPSGLDLSFDQGRSWVSQAIEANYHSLDFAPEGTVAWAVGADGAVARWVD